MPNKSALSRIAEYRALQERATAHSQGVISPDITAVLEAFPRLVDKIAEIEAQRNDTEGLLASTTDLLNSWAREWGVPEAPNEKAIKAVVNALWDRAANEKLWFQIERTKREELIVEAEALDKQNDVLIEENRRLVDVAEAAIAFLPKCAKCEGTGNLEGQHKPGFTHYETDAGEPCPAYHFGSVPCACAPLRAVIQKLKRGKA